MKKILTVVIAAIITQSLTAQITRIKVSHDTTNDIQYDAVPVPQDNMAANIPSCTKFRIQITNDDRCLLGSKTRWIVGYVTTGNSTQYWDYRGTPIDKSKVVSYTGLPKYNRSLFSSKKKSSASTFDVARND
jgi:hypothetical protein